MILDIGIFLILLAFGMGLKNRLDKLEDKVQDTRECLEILSDTVEFIIDDDMQDDEIDWYYTEPMSDKEWEEIKKMMLKGWKK